MTGDSLLARVARVEITSREAVLGGHHFGDVGAYEKLVGTIHFVFDPEDAANALVVDLALAPRNADGLVEAHGDLMVLRPVEPERGSGTALLEVSNRGGKASLPYFNRAESFASDPTSWAHFGDGLLMRRGLTVIWVGWQFDVPREPGRLRLHVPVAGSDDDPIVGWVRSDWTVDAPAASLDVAHRSHVAYATLDLDDPEATLTVRDGRLAPRRIVPRDRWRFAVPRDGVLVPDGTHVAVEGGFDAGKIYELVYRAARPAVVGLGLAVIRDTMAFAKYDEACPFGVERGLAVGISQTGRFLRHFLHQGFNTDEDGRPVFDGMLVHTAGAGRGSFNHRFAQPSRDGHRYSAFFYPTDLFPFSGRAQRDPVTDRREGLLDRLDARGHVPRIMYTNTGYEYWGRAASLLHTSPDGADDVEPLEHERIYHLASGQHFVSSFPPQPQAQLPGAAAWRGNPLDFLVTERALLVALQEWVEDGTAPPPSAYPRVDEATLVPIEELGFPNVPGVPPPKVAHEAYRADYGPDWERGIIGVQPPELGPAFAVRVPRVDDFGNELGGLPTVETLAPLATYTPWSVRTAVAGGAGELTDFFGNWIPLPRDDAARSRTGDGRPSITATYASREQYLARARAAARELVDRRILLPEDVSRVLLRAADQWDWIMGP